MGSERPSIVGASYFIATPKKVPPEPTMPNPSDAYFLQLHFAGWSVGDVRYGRRER
jgi:hypothetical protein